MNRRARLKWMFKEESKFVKWVKKCEDQLKILVPCSNKLYTINSYTVYSCIIHECQINNINIHNLLVWHFFQLILTQFFNHFTIYQSKWIKQCVCVCVSHCGQFAPLCCCVVGLHLFEAVCIFSDVVFVSVAVLHPSLAVLNLFCGNFACPIIESNTHHHLTVLCHPWSTLWPWPFCGWPNLA